MDVLDCIRTRRSIRSFLSRPVEFNKILAICESGHHAPSAGNLQNWRFVILTNKNVINSLPPHCLNQDFVAAPVVIVVCSQNDNLEKHFGIRGSRLYAIQDCAAAIQNMLLTAHALGLGATWVGAFDEEKIGEICKIPSSARPQALIVLGYPDEDPATKQMRKLDDVVSFNTYGSRIKDIHMELRNYSDELEKKTREVQQVVTKGKRKITDYVTSSFKRKGIYKR